MGYLRGKSILVTGGTGSFGSAFVRHVLKELEPERVVVFSRDELKQSDLRQQIGHDARVRWFLGNVREIDRLRRAFEGIDAVVHAAALKQIDTAEWNPIECIRTNVLGADNVVNAAIDCGVERVVALSTDKASSPVNLYGATKLCSDKLFVVSNHQVSDRPTRFSVVRYGNVFASRGSVVPLFQRLAASGLLPITDLRMTRFCITIGEAVQFVVDGFDRMRGGEVFVPKIPSTRLVDVAAAVAPEAELVEVGTRPGEKLHEEMIAEDDSRRTRDFGDHFVITPAVAEWPGAGWDDGEAVADGFCYRSDRNDRWLSVEEIRALIAAEA